MTTTDLNMPAARDFGWTLKPNERAYFDIHKRPNALFSVVLNDALLSGARADNPIARLLNARHSVTFGPEFFAARQRHNEIEVGTFETHLPVLFAQTDDLPDLSYSRAQDPAPQGRQQGVDRSLFDARVAGFAAATDAYKYPAFDQPSFL